MMIVREQKPLRWRRSRSCSFSFPSLEGRPAIATQLNNNNSNTVSFLIKSQPLEHFQLHHPPSMVCARGQLERERGVFSGGKLLLLARIMIRKKPYFFIIIMIPTVGTDTHWLEFDFPTLLCHLPINGMKMIIFSYVILHSDVEMFRLWYIVSITTWTKELLCKHTIKICCYGGQNCDRDCSMIEFKLKIKLFDNNGNLAATISSYFVPELF